MADDHELGAHLERLLKAAGQDVPSSRPTLEVNPAHVLVTRFAAEADEQRRVDWANILFDQALLSEGGRLPDPAGFVRRLNEMFIAVAGEGSGLDDPPPARKAAKASKKARGSARTAKGAAGKKKAASKAKSAKSA